MNYPRLRNQLLFGAVLISLLTALANMLAVSWVIRNQSLDQSSAMLGKAQRVIADTLAERKKSMLVASRQLAAQKNLGSTIWYLEQYADSGLDRVTLLNTYQQLARDTYQTGHIANVARIAIYNSTGVLVTFALINERVGQYGFVESLPERRFQVAQVLPGKEQGDAPLQSFSAIAGVRAQFGASLPDREETRYTLIDGVLALETRVPVMDQGFNPVSGKPEIRQMGLLVMDEPLDSGFVRQLSTLTDTRINVFTAHGFGSGNLPEYRKPDWSGIVPEAMAHDGIRFNEIKVRDVGYYQGLRTLYQGDVVAGYIATLHGKEEVSATIRQMIHTLWWIAAGSLLFIIPFAWYFATSISRPLSSLQRIFRKVAQGERAGLERHHIEHELGRVSSGEIGDLAQSFIQMNDSIKQKIHEIHQINTNLESTVAERTAALAAREQESRTLIENSQDSIARYDRDCRRIYVNPAFAAMLGCSREALIGRRPSEVPGGEQGAFYEAKLRDVFETAKNSQFELRWTGPDGRQICTHIQMTAELDPAGEVSRVMAVGRDITDRIEFEATIWQQANFDALTNLPNRRMFYDRLAQEAKAQVRSGHSLALMLIDLDHFKEINDTLGHDAGDSLLIEAARRISSCLRSGDTVARLGGDEFTIILPGLHGAGSLDRIAQELIATLSRPFQLGGTVAYVTASIGITVYPDDASDLEALFKHADQAMYAAKNAGRNGFHYFTPSLQDAAQQRLQLSTDLRHALSSGQFHLYYQPIVELAGQPVSKAEALLRWEHPVHGLMLPDTFIPLAEETGLIAPIGDWLFKEVAQQADRWRKTLHPDFQISVNTSPVQIRDKAYDVSFWPDYLLEKGIDGQGVAIEITESMLLNADSGTDEKLRLLHAAGIQVTVEDFGTGYSSLALLKRYDIDLLKIDRSCVQSLGGDADGLALCAAIILMAHTLGLKVIAEGVETDEQRHLLAQAGCDFAQGFLYSGPVPAPGFERLLQTLAATS